MASSHRIFSHSRRQPSSLALPHRSNTSSKTEFRKTAMLQFQGSSGCGFSSMYRVQNCARLSFLFSLSTIWCQGARQFSLYPGWGGTRSHPRPERAGRECRTRLDSSDAQLLILSTIGGPLMPFVHLNLRFTSLRLSASSMAESATRTLIIAWINSSGRQGGTWGSIAWAANPSGWLCSCSEDRAGRLLGKHGPYKWR